jgi:hypothetical protein
MDTSELSRLLLKAKAQKFGKDDSQIVSALMHPVEAINRGGEWFRHNVAQASGGDPYDNPNPLYGATQEQQAESGLNIAGLAQLGAMPGAPASAGGTLGTFIGPKASGWDKEKAALAKKLLDEGSDPAQVWKDTLHGRLPGSNFPISEIDDGWATINSDNLTSAKKLGEILDHPELYKQYPHIKDVDFQYDPSYTGAGFDAGIDKIILGKGSSEDINKSNLLHEASHVIDKYEGRPEGGMPVNSSPMAMDVYNRLTGEALARSVQAREPMTMGMRRNTYPMEGGKLDDVPIRRLIDRYDNEQMSGSVAANQLPETEFSQAHKLAQEHAALPVEQGGLGLPPDNTAMDRAKALGFNTEAYHGTNQPIESFNSDMLGENTKSISAKKHHWFTDSPEVANDYAEYASQAMPPDIINYRKQLDKLQKDITRYENSGKWDEAEKAYNQLEDLETEAKSSESGQNVMKLLLKKSGKTTDIDKIPLSFNNGLSDIVGNKKFHTIKNLQDSPYDYRYDEPIKSTHYATRDPKNIRSRFAAFDPFNKDSANILASALLGTSLASQMKDKNGN